MEKRGVTRSLAILISVASASVVHAAPGEPSENTALEETANKANPEPLPGTVGSQPAAHETPTAASEPAAAVDRSKNTSLAGEEAEKREIWLQSIAPVAKYGGQMEQRFLPRLGRDGKTISWKEFFTLAGRDDLTQQVRAAAKSHASGGLGITLAGGLIAMVAGASALQSWRNGEIDLSTGQVTHSLPKRDLALTLAGAFFMTIGIVTYASAVEYPELSLAQVLEMLKRYNSGEAASKL